MVSYAALRCLLQKHILWFFPFQNHLLRTVLEAVLDLCSCFLVEILFVRWSVFCQLSSWFYWVSFFLAFYTNNAIDLKCFVSVSIFTGFRSATIWVSWYVLGICIWFMYFFKQFKEPFLGLFFYPCSLFVPFEFHRLLLLCLFSLFPYQCLVLQLWNGLRKAL